MQLLPGIHQISVNYKNRPLNLYLLRFGNQSLLMDTGDATVPPKDIFPYFASINFDPKSLTYIMLTHPDLDHTGGAYALREVAPQAQFLCGTLDKEQIETPENLADLRAGAHKYWHNIGPDDAKRTSFIQNAGGSGQRLSFARTFTGGESLQLGDQSLRILHLPGHSLGHLGVHIPTLNTAIIGDAVHGTANRFLDGKAAFACTYMWIDSYLGTIDRLQAMNLDHLYSCHWPNCDSPAAVNAFLNESRSYCLKAEQAILDTLRRAGPAGFTLKDLCLQAKPHLGDWPPERDLTAAYMVCGHLQRLANTALIHYDDARPTRYFANPAWTGLR